MPLRYVDMLMEWLEENGFEYVEGETDEPYDLFQKPDKDGILKVRISVE